MTQDTCPECGAAWARVWDAEMTLVGFYSPPGHDHDDNCLKRQYRCVNGHDVLFALRRSCDVPGCGWVGRAACGCHPGPKLDRWPKVAA